MWSSWEISLQALIMSVGLHMSQTQYGKGSLAGGGTRLTGPMRSMTSAMGRFIASLSERSGR